MHKINIPVSNEKSKSNTWSLFYSLVFFDNNIFIQSHDTEVSSLLKQGSH